MHPLAVHLPTAVFEETDRRDLWRGVGPVTLVATLVLMWLGAFTRASMAGISCPDWPLCHGFVVPPTSDAAYPPAPMYTAYKIYLEFGHRLLAAFVGLGALVLGVRAWRTRARLWGVALWILLGLQILMGAVTVLERNAPYTVVAHLALALAFVTLLLALRQRTSAREVYEVGDRGICGVEVGLTALVVVQLLIGAKISSSHYGLACVQFPLCLDGALLPETWTQPVVWQVAHRSIAGVLVIALLALFGQRLCMGDLHALRRAAIALALIFLQICLGAANVWLRVPPWASALHLAVGAVLFAVLVHPLTALRRSAIPNLRPVAASSSER